MELDASKDKMRRIIKNKEEEVSALKATTECLEKRVMSNVKVQLLEAKETFDAQKQRQSVSIDMSKVIRGRVLLQWYPTRWFQERYVAITVGIF